MQVVVTGASSPLGQALLHAIAQRGTLLRADGQAVPVRRILAVDRTQSPGGLFIDPRIEYVRGDYEMPRFLARMMGTGTDSIFHLSVLDVDDSEPVGLLSLETALERTVDTTRMLLDACQYQTAPVKLVLAGTQGGWPAGGALPPGTRDTCAAMCELLLNDSARRRLVDARSVRLPVWGAGAVVDPADAAQRLLRAHEVPREDLPASAPPPVPPGADSPEPAGQP